LMKIGINYTIWIKLNKKNKKIWKIKPKNLIIICKKTNKSIKRLLTGITVLNKIRKIKKWIQILYKLPKTVYNLKMRAAPKKLNWHKSLHPNNLWMAVNCKLLSNQKKRRSVRTDLHTLIHTKTYMINQFKISWMKIKKNTKKKSNKVC